VRPIVLFIDRELYGFARVFEVNAGDLAISGKNLTRLVLNEGNTSLFGRRIPYVRTINMKGDRYFRLSGATGYPSYPAFAPGKKYASTVAYLDSYNKTADESLIAIWSILTSLSRPTS
jgi:hypothetical protein